MLDNDSISKILLFVSVSYSLKFIPCYNFIGKPVFFMFMSFAIAKAKQHIFYFSYTFLFFVSESREKTFTLFIKNWQVGSSSIKWSKLGRNITSDFLENFGLLFLSNPDK